jgi:hypothetical protein
MRTWLPPIYLAVSLVVLLWDIALAGRIAQHRHAPRTFQALSGLCALLVLPALLLSLATSTTITGRSVVTMDWIWPAILVLFAIQALYAIARRLVNLAWGVPIAVYDVVIAAVGTCRFLAAQGHTLPLAATTLLRAHAVTLTFATGTATTLAVPFYLSIPMISPAFPALHRITASFRAAVSALAVAWVLFFVTLGVPRAGRSERDEARRGELRLRERPNADFAVGIKILPDVSRPPPAPTIKSDMALVDSLNASALGVVFVPGASTLAMDSVAHVVGPLQRDSTLLLVALGYRGTLLPELHHQALNESARITTVQRIMRHVHPNVLLPAEDPYGIGGTLLGKLPVATWEAYITDAARAARAIDPHVKIGVSIASFSSADSALYAWAASPGSPVDIIGFSLFSSPYTGGDLEALERAADRWMRSSATTKEHWVFATGGFPVAYGESNQARSIWQVLSWATAHPSIKGALVYEAGDYGRSRGLRAPDGRLRQAAMSVAAAIRGLQESAR